MTDKRLRFNKERFLNFLRANGHQVLATLSQWEVVRFRNGNGTGIVYQDKHGRLKFTGEAETARDRMYGGDPYPAPEKRKKCQIPRGLHRTLVARDGTDCFYCGEAMDDGDMSVEHLLARNAGGTEHVSNLALAHKTCNLDAGHLSVVEKVKLRDRKRAAVEDARDAALIAALEDLDKDEPFHSE